MTEKTDPSRGTLPTAAVVLGALLVGGLVVAFLKGVTIVWVSAFTTIVSEGALAAVIVVAAGGYGYLPRTNLTTRRPGRSGNRKGSGRSRDEGAG